MNAKTDEQDEARVIIFLGDDNSYWSIIKARVTQKCAGKPTEFHSIKLATATNYQVLFLETLRLKPNIIFLDFSSNLEFTLKLAHMLNRENLLKSCPVIGLVEKKENIVDCLFSGVEVVHVKCGEYHDIIYDAFYMAFPGETEAPNFAKAEFERDATLNCDFRIGFITPKSVHAEGNVKIDGDTALTLETDIPIKLVPSNKYICKENTDFNLYFDYKYNYEFQFIYVDEPEFNDDELEERLEGLDENQRILIIKTTKENIRQSVLDYKGRLTKTKKDVNNWIVDNMDRVKPKKTKILIIDKELRFIYNPSQILGNLTYTIRIQTSLTEELRDIKVLRPDIISFQFLDLNSIKQEIETLFEDGLKEDGTPYGIEELNIIKEQQLKDKVDDAESAALDQLSLILKTIKTLDGYKPFIILFNCHSYSSQSIQESFKYPFVIVNKNEIDIDPIMNMASMLEKRNDKKISDLISSKVEMLKKSDPKKYKKLTRQDIEEKKYFISNKNSLSKISTSFPIVLKSMTESELSFTSHFEFALGTYRLDFPTNMSIRIVPIDGNNYEVDGKNKIYHALIHSVGEEEKKKIRQFVNEIFFSELNQKRIAEEQAFKELNDGERMKRVQEMENIEDAEAEALAKAKEANENPEDVIPVTDKS
ncbi:MAG: hypothetical protein HN576_03850 [Bacteriovoracaceae bacterium]|nr:hypothetical protein [Bacteriovoracaceae bacterium]